MNNIEKLLAKHEIVKIDLNGGTAPQRDYINVDYKPFKGVDVVWDVAKDGIPFPNSCATLILAGQVVTRVNPVDFGFIKFMDECWRTLKVGGQLLISASYAGSTPYYSDPTNVNPITAQTFTFFDPLHPSGAYKYHTPKPWEVKQCFFQTDGNLEVLLVKRKEDISYGKN